MCRFPVNEVYQCFYMYNCSEHEISYRYLCQAGFLRRRECPNIDKSQKPLVDDMIVGLCPKCTAMGRETPAPPPAPSAEDFCIDLFGDENIIDGKTEAALALNPAAKLLKSIKDKLDAEERKMEREMRALYADLGYQYK